MASIDGYDRYMDQQLYNHLHEDEPCCTVCGASFEDHTAYSVDGELLCKDCMDNHMDEYMRDHEVDV